jgi:acetyltransferase-like isoleucine patch superfamily enzyme
VIASCTTIGFAVNIKRSASIGHHCLLEDYVTINPGVTISSNVRVGTQTMIGAGSVVRDGISIGRNCVIGMGSVVLKDLPDDVVAYGNPCVVVKTNGE